MLAYFSTAVFDQLYRKDGCSSADIAALRKAIYGRELTVRLSLHNLEEILTRKERPQALSAQLRQALSFASLRSLIKPCENLLIDDVRNYAAQGAASNPFLHGPIQDDISSGIAELIETDGEEFTDEFRAVLDEVRRQRFKIVTLCDRLRMTIAEKTDEPQSEIFTPEKLRFEFGPSLASKIAILAGVSENCAERGLSGLLEIRTVGIAVMLILANAAEQSSRWAEVHHVLSAAAAGGVLVCGAGEEREMLAPFAHAGLLPEKFEAIGLSELLERVAH